MTQINSTFYLNPSFNQLLLEQYSSRILFIENSDEVLTTDCIYIDAK